MAGPVWRENRDTKKWRVVMSQILQEVTLRVFDMMEISDSGGKFPPR
jgi:hypothetical protein